MSGCAEWIEDMLGVVKESQNPEAVRMIEGCGARCAARKDIKKAMLLQKAAASNCKTRADYVAFFRETMAATVEEAEDGIVMHLNKEECSCPMAPEIQKNADMLCECTRGFNKAVWSDFFGKPVEVETIESFLRGGNDCVFKIFV